MPQATKIVVHFDDGSTFEIDPATTSSIFIGEANAKKCGHRPPWRTPGNGSPSTGNLAETTDAAAASTDSTEAARLLGGSCYYVNGVIYCP